MMVSNWSKVRDSRLMFSKCGLFIVCRIRRVRRRRLRLRSWISLRRRAEWRLQRRAEWRPRGGRPHPLVMVDGSEAGFGRCSTATKKMQTVTGMRRRHPRRRRRHRIFFASSSTPATTKTRWPTRLTRSCLPTIRLGLDYTRERRRWFVASFIGGRRQRRSDHGKAPCLILSSEPLR
ncbi:hypothetical protein VPH35_122377 [Triticum aestivum]